MKIKFYLKRPKADSPTSIYALVNYAGQSLKVYTKESIDPKFWNPTTNAARQTPKFTEGPEFNQRLNNIRSTISKVFMDFKNDNGHNEPSPAILKPLIEQALNKDVQKTTFLNFFDDFATRSLNGKRIDPKSKQPIRPSVGRGFKTTYNHLVLFSKSWRRMLDFDTIDAGFHEDFTKYMADNNYAVNYLGTHVKRIKTVLAEATRRKLNTNLEFKQPHFVKVSEEADTIFLNESELQEILKLKLDERLGNARDLFLIGCYTGLRFSDFSVLKARNIHDGFIRIKQVKTSEAVTIPVHPIVKKILAKRKGEPPKYISNADLNKFIKEVCQQCTKLKVTQDKTTTRGGTKVTVNYAKWELVSTHTARRSFATNEFLAGTPTLTIMAITGHKSEKAFLRYIRVAGDDHAKIMKGLWEKRNNLVAV